MSSRRKRGLGAMSVVPSLLLLDAILLHCHSVSVPIGAALLARERVPGIDPAIGGGTTRGGHALGVAGELAIAGIAPLAPLQAVAILYGLSSSSRY
jgi:hypothetical protein